MNRYDDKTLLFITSTDSRVPQGRNARAHHRAQAASQATAALKGEFVTLDFTSAEADDDGQPRKRQRRCNTSTKVHRSAQDGILELVARTSGSQSIRSLDTGWALPFINPDDILSVATFHIRRMATMSMSSEPERLSTLLRRRQWSCVPFAGNCFGKDPCVDSAVLCVADRIRFLSGSPFSTVAMMRHYESALRDLQAALDEPAKHHPQDLLAAVQLLAVYEMLDAGDSEGWAKHVAGASTLIQTHTSITPQSLEKWESRGCANAMPMFGDALMNGDVHFFRTYPWRELLWAIFAKVPDPPEGILDLMQCLRLMPGLLLDVDAATKQELGMGDDTRFSLLDRAHDIRRRTVSALSGNKMYHRRNYRERLTTFDLLGTFLSAVVALDGIIATLAPPWMLSANTANDETEQLCVQLLQLELGAMAQYPPADVLAGFSQGWLAEQAS